MMGYSALPPCSLFPLLTPFQVCYVSARGAGECHYTLFHLGGDPTRPGDIIACKWETPCDPENPVRAVFLALSRLAPYSPCGT